MSGFRMRRGSSTAWTAANPVLGEGELGLDFNASMFKIGNGVSSWTQLPYYSSGGGAADGFNRLAAGTQTAGTNTTVVFANSNGLTFGMSGSSQITASHNGLTTAALSDHSHGVTLNLTNLSGTTGGNSAGITLSLSANSQSVQTQNMVSVQGSTGNISFSNSNGITFGFNNSTITASHNGLTTAALSNHSHGNPTLALTNLSGTTASNSAGLTLSLSAATGLTSQSNQAFSASGGSSAFQTLVFTNGNGVTFTNTNGSLGASVATTYAASNHSHGNPTLALTNLSGTTASNSNGLTLSLSAAAPGGGGGVALSAGTQSVSTGTVVYSNSNGVSFGMSGSSRITASHDGIRNLIINGSAGAETLTGTQATLSFQTPLYGQLNVANEVVVQHSPETYYASGNTTLTSSGIGDGAASHVLAGVGAASVGFSVNRLFVSVPTQTVQTQNLVSVQGSTGNISFSNSNGITFGFNNSTITASHNGLTSQSNQALSGSNGSFTFQTATFGNLNGVSFYTSNGSLVASHNGLTTAAQSNHSHGNPTLALTNLSGTTASNSNGLTLSLSAAAPGGGGAINVSAGTTSGNLQTLVFNNSNGVSFGLNGSTVTAEHNGVKGVLVGTYTLNPSPAANDLLRFDALNNRAVISYDTFLFPNGVLVGANAPWVGISTQGNTSGTTGILSNGNLVLVGGNNITLSQATGAGGNTITISGAAGGGGGGIALGNNQTTYTSGTVSLSGINLTVESGTGNRFNLSAPATSSLVGVGGISLSTNGSTISISYIGGVGGGTATMWLPYNEGVNVLGQQGNATLHIVPLPTPPTAAGGEVHIDRLCIPLHFTRSTSAGTVSLSHSFGLYTRTGSTLSQLASTSYSTSWAWNSTQSSSVQDGIRLHTIPWTTTLGDGRYYVAQWSRTSTAGSNASLSQVLVSQINSNFSGIFGQASNRSNQWPLGYGVYSVSVTTAMPNSINFNQIDGTASLAARPPSFFMISGTA
jgi:outer membrane protein OmpA-like peptidoglycan-associated protein